MTKACRNVATVVATLAYPPLANRVLVMPFQSSNAEHSSKQLGSASLAQFNRRSFLHRGAQLGSTLGFAAATATAHERASAADTLVVAVVGVNGQGRTHARNFASQKGAEVAYICDVDERVIPRAIEETAQHQRRKPIAVRDFRNVLDDPAVDIVSIATPNHWHGAGGDHGVRRGKARLRGETM